MAVAKQPSRATSISRKRPMASPMTANTAIELRHDYVANLWKEVFAAGKNPSVVFVQEKKPTLMEHLRSLPILRNYTYVPDRSRNALLVNSRTLMITDEFDDTVVHEGKYKAIAVEITEGKEALMTSYHGPHSGLSHDEKCKTLVAMLRSINGLANQLSIDTVLIGADANVPPSVCRELIAGDGVLRNRYYVVDFHDDDEVQTMSGLWRRAIDYFIISTNVELVSAQTFNDDIEEIFIIDHPTITALVRVHKVLLRLISQNLSGRKPSER